MKRNNLIAILGATMASFIILTGCSANDIAEALNTPIDSGTATTTTTTVSADDEEAQQQVPENEVSNTTEIENEELALAASVDVASTSTLLDTSDLFSERDIEQEADTSDATTITLTSGEDVNITEEGVYVISGIATDTTIIVETDDTAKVQLVLDSVTITNSDSPTIYVKSADKVFVTTTDSENTLKVTGTFTADGTTNTDAVIFAKDDIVINGTGNLNIESTANGISGKDDVKLTGGTLNITAAEDAVEANDSIRIYDGTYNITAGKDAFHAENDEDYSVGYVYIHDGTFNIDADDDGIQATTVMVIDGGSYNISAAEGIESTYVQINDGTINISASDDGINASAKSTYYDIVIEINGGDITINMGSGDTDAIDSNGYIYINGGTIDITATSAFDYISGAELNGGTVTVNGETITQITSSMMGGGMQGGGMGGQQGSPGNQNGNANQSGQQQGMPQGGGPQGGGMGGPQGGGGMR